MLKGNKPPFFRNILQGQQEIVEYKGKRVLRIYAALDNKQVEFQSHMIEVEGKNNDQHLVILIDSGASHSYLDPKLMERFQLSRSKLRKPWLM